MACHMMSSYLRSGHLGARRPRLRSLRPRVCVSGQLLGAPQCLVHVFQLSRAVCCCLILYEQKIDRDVLEMAILSSCSCPVGHSMRRLLSLAQQHTSHSPTVSAAFMRAHSSAFSFRSLGAGAPPLPLPPRGLVLLLAASSGAAAAGWPSGTSSKPSPSFHPPMRPGVPRTRWKMLTHCGCATPCCCHAGRCTTSQSAPAHQRVT